ncbi:ABC transporter permease [Gordonia sp. ABSL49_1]|uniref:ABC transporter permease n=1 Tax=Gordonia sp. ABSL49_1 TaxID=2920941 RepID=UPI001F0D31FC|nr:ABC transporter permease [Gordonia sp. ABSL49_1]MCH5643172.1 ABC transporter permease [Gordonia sp. ABSL49_1]
MTAPAELSISRDAFANTGKLLRLMLRRERWTMLITFVVFVALNVSTAASIASGYSTTQERLGAQAGLGGNAAFRFLLGPLDHIDSTASMTVWRAGLFMIAALGVCVVLLVVRQTRKEEELGRTELLRASVTGPLAPVVAAAVTALLFSVVVALGMSLMLFPLGAGPMDVVAVFAQYATTGLAAAGAALVTAQVAKTSHIANLAAASVVLVGYLLRGVADAIDGWDWLRWVTPLGWAQLIDPFGANNLWFALASMAVFVIGLALACSVVMRRDLGAGLIAPRPGPAWSDRLRSVLSIHGWLTVPLLASWAGGVAAYGLIVGFMQPSVEQLASGNSPFEDVVRSSELGADLSTLFGMTMMGFFAVAASAWAVNVATRMRAEEESSRTELILSSPTSRTRQHLAYVTIAAGGVVVILLLAVAAMTVGNAIAGGNWSSAGSDALRAGAAQIPASLVMASVALALYGFRSSLVPAGWILVIAALFLGPLSGMFGLPQWAEDLSPFTHTPQVPVARMQWTPIVVMLCVAAVVTVAGWAAFRRRDVG